MSQKNYYMFSGLVFLLAFSLHGLRVLNGWPLIIGTYTIPMWLSWLAIIIAGTLAYHGLRKK